MEETKFDQDYERFLNGYACDVGYDAILELVRDAFAAGWRAAGGDPAEAPPVKRSRWEPPRADGPAPEQAETEEKA